MTRPMSISYVLVLFLLQLAAGMMATIALIPTGVVDRRFFKSISFWSALFIGLGLLAKRHSQFRLAAAFAVPDNLLQLARSADTLYLFFGLICLTLWARLRFSEKPLRRRTLVLTALAGLAAVFTDSLIYRPAAGPAWVHQLLIPMNFVSASLILGGFLAGMIFGHWFLVNTEMPKRLLVTMAGLLIGVLAFRIAAFGATLALEATVVHPGENFLAGLTSLQGHGIFFWQRVLVGLAIPAGVVAMVWNTTKIGSNQSATGIIYVGIAFVFIGELAARYLFLMTGIPL